MTELAGIVFLVALATIGAAALLAWTRDGLTLRSFAGWLFDRRNLTDLTRSTRYLEHRDTRSCERHR